MNNLDALFRAFAPPIEPIPSGVHPFAVRIYAAEGGRKLSVLAKSSCDAAICAIGLICAEVDEIRDRCGLKIVVEPVRGPE